MIGPMDFTMNDEAGVLVEGFEREPLIKQPWHPPYYARRLEEAGMAKAMDLFMWELEISDREKMRPILFDLAADLEPKHGVRIRKMSFWRLRQEMDRFADVYNSAWRENWGFVPYSKEDLDFYADELWLVFDKPWFMVADARARRSRWRSRARHQPGPAEDERARAAVRLVALPAAQADRRPRPRRVPRVKPEYQHTGVAAGLYVEHFDESARSRSSGARWAGSSRPTAR